MNVKLISTTEDGLKWTSKQSYMSQKLFDNDLVAIYKSKVPLTVNKSVYVAMIILDLSTSYIMITLKIIIVTAQDYYSLTHII